MLRPLKAFYRAIKLWVQGLGLGNTSGLRISQGDVSELYSVFRVYMYYLHGLTGVLRGLVGIS